MGRLTKRPLIKTTIVGWVLLISGIGNFFAAIMMADLSELFGLGTEVLWVWALFPFSFLAIVLGGKLLEGTATLVKLSLLLGWMVINLLVLVAVYWRLTQVFRV